MQNVSRRIRLQPVVATAGLAALALIVAAGLAPDRGAFPFVAVLGLVALGSLAYLAWHIDPAWTLTASFCLSVFSGNWRELGLPAYFHVVPDRAVLVAGVLALLLRAPGARDRPPIRIEPIHWLLGITLLVAAISAWSAGTLLSNASFFQLFDRFGIAPFAMFLLAPVAFYSQAQRKVLLGALTVVGGYLGLTALFETVGPAALVFPKYILDPAFGIHLNRARGPFLEAEANGIALYFCGVAAVVSAVVWRDRVVVRAASLAVGVLCAAGCLFTLQRGVWLGTVVATLVTLLAFRSVRRFLLPAVTALAVLVIGSFVLIPGLGSQASERASDQHSLWDRYNLNAAALSAAQANPLTGLGWGRFPIDGARYFQQSASYPLTAVGGQPCTEAGSIEARVTGEAQACTQAVHNAYLSTAAELGFIGALLWVLSLVLAIGGAVVRPSGDPIDPWRVGLLALATMWAIVVFFTPMEGPFSPLVLWTWAGIAWGSGRVPERRRPLSETIPAAGSGG